MDIVMRVRDMRKLFAVYACWALGLAASFAAAAVEVTGLYEAEVPVASQDAVERAAASRAALAEVLVKVSGSAEVAQRPELKSLLEQAEQWVQRYQYRAAPPATGATTAGAQGAPTRLLWMSFDRQTVNQRLSDAGLPVWGVNRPSILLWVAVEDGGKRYLVGGDNRPDLQGSVNAEARRRGLSLNLPLLDLQDQGSLAVADVWGDFSEMILKASERYQPDAVLVGRVYAVAADKWQSHWTLYHRGSVSSWESAEGLQDEAVAAGIDGAAEQLAKRYALELTPGIGDSVLLTVENVATLTDYARVTHYLQSLDPVAEVQVARVEGAKVSYRLKVRGQTQGLIQTIAWGKTLAPSQPESDTTAVAQAAGEDKGAETSAGGEELRYRMLP
jgi:hypothetical protein